MSLTIRAAARTDPGKVRDNNEDSYHSGTRIFCVADGLGGHLAGEIASRIAVETVAALESRPPEEAVRHLAEEVRHANRLVHEEAKSDPAKAGMGTTMTAVVIDDSAAHLAHVGDSRCYLFRDGDVTLLTDDHTVVGRMIAEGMLTEEQAADHPQRSMLTRAIGTQRTVDVDVTHVPLHDGDRLLLCSDGLTAVVQAQELPRLVSGTDLDTLVDGLVDLTLQRGAPDNVTVVLLEVTGTPSGGSRSASSDGVRHRRSRRRPGAGPRFLGVPRRALLWFVFVAIVVVAGVFGVRSYVDGSYYVGFDSDERVAIYNGVPVEVPLLTKQRLVESYENMPAEHVREGLRPELDQGIIFGSLDEARDYVEELRSNLVTPAKTPLTKPSTKATPTGGGG